MNGDTLVSLRDVADRLDELSQRYPDSEAEIEAIARELVRMPATRPFSPEDNPWLWPRPEWKGWQDALEDQLGSVPESLWRSIVITVRKHPNPWVQIAGTDSNGFSLQVHDPDHKFSNLGTLGWNPRTDLPGPPGTFWEPPDPKWSVSSAADSAAQALALGMRMRPQDVDVEKMTF
ncbi:hypothetical protein NOCD_14300 [Nocardioides cavernae]|uniref:hypothetical protein n=1 Tax=Nocardioides TaxID=1839 RepID=UPI0012E34218|nr:MULTISPECIES: hypothetical protein [Nocardioides]MCK9824652.1 hypothetical protein [Nocardioides cavernae]